MKVKEKVAEAVSLVNKMNKKERHLFVVKLMDLESVVEDLYDVAELRRTRSESSRPYDEVAKELKAKGRM